MFDNLWNLLQCWYRRVQIGKGTQIIGKIELQGHGTVVIGENVKIYSTWRKNPVGGYWKDGASNHWRWEDYYWR